MGEDEFIKVKRVFDKQNDAQHIDTVVNLYKRYGKQIGGKENLVSALKPVFTAGNHSVNEMDQELMMMLKRIL